MKVASHRAAPIIWMEVPTSDPNTRCISYASPKSINATHLYNAPKAKGNMTERNLALKVEDGGRAEWH